MTYDTMSREAADATFERLASGVPWSKPPRQNAPVFASLVTAEDALEPAEDAGATPDAGEATAAAAATPRASAKVSVVPNPAPPQPQSRRSVRAGRRGRHPLCTSSDHSARQRHDA